MDNDSQGQAARGGRPPGAVNYPHRIVERLLPQGLEGWRSSTILRLYQSPKNSKNQIHVKKTCSRERRGAQLER